MRVLFLLVFLAGGVGFVGYQFAQQGGFFLANSMQLKPSIEKVMKDLENVESSLGELYEHLSTLSPEAAIEKSTAALDRIKTSYEILGQHNNVSSEIERRAQMIVVRSHYLASKILPPVEDAFVSQAKQVIQLRPDSDDAAIAKVLMFCVENDLSDSADERLLEDMASEARSYGAERHGVGLYSIVAHEFWKNGKVDAAETVLENGIALYRGTNEKMPLVHQMIDQGHRDPPEPKMSQAQFARMQRAMERMFSGATSVGCNMVFRS